MSWWKNARLKHGWFLYTAVPDPRSSFSFSSARDTAVVEEGCYEPAFGVSSLILHVSVSLGLASIHYSNCTLQTKPIIFPLSFSVPFISLIPVYFTSLLLKNLETLVLVVHTKLRVVNTKLKKRMFFPFGDQVSYISAGVVQGCTDEHSAKGCVHAYLVSNPEKFRFITLLSMGRIVARSSGQQLAALILSLPAVPCFTCTLLSKFSRC